MKFINWIKDKLKQCLEINKLESVQRGLRSRLSLLEKRVDAVVDSIYKEA